MAFDLLPAIVVPALGSAWYAGAYFRAPAEQRLRGWSDAYTARERRFKGKGAIALAIMTGLVVVADLTTDAPRPARPLALNGEPSGAPVAVQGR